MVMYVRIFFTNWLTHNSRQKIVIDLDHVEGSALKNCSIGSVQMKLLVTTFETKSSTNKYSTRRVYCHPHICHKILYQTVSLLIQWLFVTGHSPNKIITKNSRTLRKIRSNISISSHNFSNGMNSILMKSH